MKAAISKSTQKWILQRVNYRDADKGRSCAKRLKLRLRAWTFMCVRLTCTSADLKGFLNISDGYCQRMLHEFEAAKLITWQRGTCKAHPAFIMVRPEMLK